MSKQHSTDLIGRENEIRTFESLLRKLNHATNSPSDSFMPLMYTLTSPTFRQPPSTRLSPGSSPLNSSVQRSDDSEQSIPPKTPKNLISNSSKTHSNLPDFEKYNRLNESEAADSDNNE